MSFCVLGKDYIKEGRTQIDNIFLSSYLPSADALDCKIYLYGLYLASSESGNADNSQDNIALSLKITEERVLSAFKYWEQQGLITVTKTHPLKIVYKNIRTPFSPIIKVNAAEYSDFVEEIARLFPDRILSQNELNAFIELMHFNKIEPNAVLMIFRHCLNIKPSAGAPYVLAVASDWAKQGILTEADVNARISELEQNNEDIRAIFKTLGLKSQADIEDRQLYLKWTKDYGYKMDAILTAARTCKRRGGMEKLAKVVEEFRNAGALTAEEVNGYAKAKEDTSRLAEDIVRTLGTYYSSFDMLIETYVSPWLSKGFDAAALKTIAKFCFLRNIRTPDAMNGIVEKFYKLGILSSESIDGYIEKQIAADGYIREVLERAGSSSFVSNRDREFYRTFIEVWGFGHDAVLAAADITAGKPFPMSVINKILADMKEKNITSADGIKNYRGESGKQKKEAAKKPDEGMIKQTYTKEQLRSVFMNLGDGDADNII